MWSFTNAKKTFVSKDGKISCKHEKKKKFCDFFVLVCVEEDTNEIRKVFVVPADVIGDRLAITIPEDFSHPSKFSLEKYQDKWDSIQEF